MPPRRVMEVAEPGDYLGIALVRLGPVQLGFTEGMNLGRVDDADGDRLLDQESRQGFAIAAGRFQTDVRGRERAQPGEERLEAGGRVGEDLGFVLTVEPGRRIECRFGNVDPDGGDRGGRS